MRITSGSWRSTIFSAVRKLSVSWPISRWLIRQRCSMWRYSTGSSIVTTCASRVTLMWAIIDASVVLLPDPVEPVTSTRPSCSSARRVTIGGSPSSAMPGTSGTTYRMASATLPCWR